MSDTDYKKLWRKEKEKNTYLNNKMVLAITAVEEAKKEINRLRLKCGENIIDWNAARSFKG